MHFPIRSLLFLLTPVCLQAGQVIFTEVMYNPMGLRPEYIELTNLTSNRFDFAKWTLSGGVDFTFPDFNASATSAHMLKEYERVIISSADEATTRASWPSIPPTVRVYGPWTGSLNNSGEDITIKDAASAVQSTLTYGDGGDWPVGADGAGHSLQIINQNGIVDDWRNWRLSRYKGGSPGVAEPPAEQALTNPEISPQPAGVMINEVRPSSVPGAGFVEFYNPTGAVVDLNGYYLSDTDANLTKYKITVSTPVPAGGVAVVGFAESSLGVAVTPLKVLLTAPDGTTRQSGFQSTMAADGRSAGRKPSGGATWVLFGQPTPGLPNVTDPVPTLTLSEVHFGTTGRADWVEVYNTGTASQELAGYFVSTLPDFSNRVPLAGSLASGAYTSVDVDFATDGGGEVILYLSDSWNNLVGTAEISYRAGLPSVQAFPAGVNEWYGTPAATRDAVNNPERQTSIVINEIMAKLPSGHDEGEYLELYNAGAGAVDLGGWAFTDGISYIFPAGTSLAAGQYLVVAKNPSYITSNYAGITNVVGPFDGTVRNSGEELRLEDARGNLADVVDFRSGGQWPTGAGGEGSSLELLHPSMDNSRPSSWRASDESAKSTFQTFTHTGTYKELRGLSPGASTSRELLVSLVGDGRVILKNIKLSKASAPAVNMIASGDATSHTGNGANGFLCTGTHCESDTLPRVGATITGEPGFHLISQGGGDTKGNKAEVDITGLLPNDVLTLSFDGRWVYGLPLMVAQTWDRSFGKVFRFPIPANLGTPGAANSQLRPAAAPSVDHMAHFPAVPTSSQTVLVTARVDSATALSGVTLFHRLDSSTAAGNAWTELAMNDLGTGGDPRAGDGLWSVTVPARSNAQITQFYIEATAANGEKNECPRLGSTRPGLWIVANTAPSTAPGLLIQRSIMSLRHRNALNATTGFSAAYDWDHPRMSNYGFNSTFIFNEWEVLYNCELRRGGSPWTRTTSSTLDRTRWKPPGDQQFRERSKAGVDNDAAGTSRFHNRFVRYLLYLFGYPVPESEFIVQIINSDGARLGDEMEQTDSDFFDRAYANGSDGELFEIDDAWYFYDTNTNGEENRIDGGSVTGRWALTDWTAPAVGTFPSDESPIFFHGNWPIRFPEDRYDYSALSSMIKTATNGGVAISGAAAELAYRDKMERVLDIDRAAIYAAVRGYVGDWDNFTLNRGKNGYFYKRPGDGRFEFHHWDSDLAFQNTGEAFIGSAGGLGWSNLSVRPWFRQKFLHNLSEILSRFTTGSARTTAWLTAMNYQAANSNSLAPFKTNNYNYATSWMAPRATATLSYITTTNYNRAFTASTASGQTVLTPVFSISGAASTKVEKVVIEGHPEAVFAWTPTTANPGLWTLGNIRLASGLNTLSLQAILGDGTVSATLSFTVTLTGNAPPEVVLAADPASGNVAAGETLALDATGSLDPEGLPLSYNWTVTPSTGVTLTQPAPGQATVRFTTPGNYSLTLQVTDALPQTTTLTRELTVFNGADFAGFDEDALLGPEYTLTNLEERDNFSPSAWYSLEDLTGRLMIQVLEDSAKPLAVPDLTHPLVTRDLPDSADFVLQTELRPDTREFGNWRAGLMLVINEGGTAVRYTFGLDAGLNLISARAAGAEVAYTTLSTTAVTGSGAGLRVVRKGASLLFQYRTAAGWVTVLDHLTGAGSVADNGGVFVATSTATSVRIGFDYILVADPTEINHVLNNLRLTEIQYRPAAGGVEYLELRNTGTESIDLTGVNFVQGQPFAMAGGAGSPYIFGAEILAPGEFIVLTDDVAGFRALHGNGPRLAPAWTSGSLSNSGEEIILQDANGNAIHNFTYGTTAPWPAAANGGGPSMEVIDVNGNYALGTNWRASALAGGSPGTDGSPAVDSDGDGMSDAQEALFGTNPNSAGSVPAVTLVLGTGGEGILSWPSVPNVVYTVQTSTLLSSGWDTMATVTGLGLWTFTPVPGEPRRFYRVIATAP